ncbi:hypothetical protein F01_260323 [Burkholderia cenocepacia]|nr:hypothetical protein F01_260323 [Burkholderia cenocepacia]
MDHRPDDPDQRRLHDQVTGPLAAARRTALARLRGQWTGAQPRGRAPVFSVPPKPVAMRGGRR